MDHDPVGTLPEPGDPEDDRAVTSSVAPISTATPFCRATFAERRWGRIVVSLSRAAVPSPRRRPPATPGRGLPHGELRGRRARLAVAETGGEGDVVGARRAPAGTPIATRASVLPSVGGRYESGVTAKRTLGRVELAARLKSACGVVVPAYRRGKTSDASPPWTVVSGPRPARRGRACRGEPARPVVADGRVRRVPRRERRAARHRTGVGRGRRHSREPTRISVCTGPPEGAAVGRPGAARGRSSGRRSAGRCQPCSSGSARCTPPSGCPREPATAAAARRCRWGWP